MIAAAERIKAAPRSDAGYVRHLFDQFSADYDARMIGQLSYAGPQILLDLASMVMPGRLSAGGSIATRWTATIKRALHSGPGLWHRFGGSALQALGLAVGRCRSFARHGRKGPGTADI